MCEPCVDIYVYIRTPKPTSDLLKSPFPNDNSYNKNELHTTRSTKTELFLDGFNFKYDKAKKILAVKDTSIFYDVPQKPHRLFWM